MKSHFDGYSVLSSGRCPMTTTRLRIVALIAIAALAGPAGAQAPDPAVRLRQVLPADVADRIIARAADAQRHHLPAAALEERALKFAARGVAPAAIEKAVAEQAERLARARTVLHDARTQAPAADEIEAGAEALREGVDAEAIASLARSAPSGRSLSVPLFVMGTLATRGVPAADALRTVTERLQLHASDADLERLPDEATARSAAAASRESAPGESGSAEESAHRAPEHTATRPVPHVVRHSAPHVSRRP